MLEDSFSTIEASCLPHRPESNEENVDELKVNFNKVLRSFVERTIEILEPKRFDGNSTNCDELAVLIEDQIPLFQLNVIRDFQSVQLPYR
ncbi:hypothetical protein M3Y98_01207000 [Aphelenchoides besseyi]|nr:hypothetical protein M3Y98_01207000 [Aphelenchoides besseyi]